jgi:hypothetical protein
MNTSIAIREIEDGIANTIAMGEIRPSSSGFQWINGWIRSERLWFATTAPINNVTDPEEAGTPSTPPQCRNWEMDFDCTTYQRPGARSDGDAAERDN